MKTALMDAVFTVIRHVRVRWEFYAAFVGSLGILILADHQQSTFLAGVGAIVMFVAGTEYGGQVICNDCAAPLAVDPEVPEYTFQA